jgi:hypothetical protein
MLTRVLLALVLMVTALAGGPLAAEEAKLVKFGISDHEVTQAELEGGAKLPAPRFNTPAVAFAWVANLKKGDVVEIALANEDKALLTNSETLEEDKANVLVQAGKRGVPAGGWPQEWKYSAKLKITRDGKTLLEKSSEPMVFE